MPKKSFKEYNQGQGCLFPRSLDEMIPEDSPARLVSQIVDNLDITKVIDTYKGGGTSSYQSRMMLKIVLFAYLNNIYSCRKIENANRFNLLYMWLSGMQTPDHNTINTFRSSRLKDTISDIFTQVVLMLVEMWHLSVDTVYVNGTKIESKANRYSFVWRKSVEKNKAKLEKYERKLEILGERSSYSKIAPAATFMHLKDDHIQNGQLKPAQNLQIATENQFFTHYDMFPNPKDTLTFIPFLQGYKNRYKTMPEKDVADAC